MSDHNTAPPMPRYGSVHIRGRRVYRYLVAFVFFLALVWLAVGTLWGPIAAGLWACFATWCIWALSSGPPDSIRTDADLLVVRGVLGSQSIAWCDVESVRLSRKAPYWIVRIAIAKNHRIPVPGYGHMHGVLTRSLACSDADAERLSEILRQAQVLSI